MSSRDKILCLESLRGLAALAVAITHFRIGSSFNNAFTDNAGLMVDLFFVLSGFVIALNYQSRIQNLRHAYLFQARRFLRLYPLHLLMLFAFLGIELLKLFAETRLGLVANNPAFQKNDLSSFLQNVFLVQNLASPDLTWNFPSWSISAEFYTYLVFAMVAVVGAGSAARRTVISILLAAAALLYLAFDVSLLPSSGFIRCIYAFFLGVLTYNCHTRLTRPLPAFTAYALFALSILVTAFADSVPNPVYWMIPVVYAALLLCLASTPDDSMLQRTLGLRPLVYLGTISYGIYMIHAFVWWVFNQTLRFGFGYETLVDEGGITHVVTGSTAISNLITVVGLLVVVLAAHLSYRWIEKPVNDYRHRLGKFE